MARTKEPIKPLLATKHDFVASLDNTIQHAINLMQAVDMVIKMGNLSEPLKKVLSEQHDKFKQSLFTE